jgi:hypothetical protein
LYLLCYALLKRLFDKPCAPGKPKGEFGNQGNHQKAYRQGIREEAAPTGVPMAMFPDFTASTISASLVRRVPG